MQNVLTNTEFRIKGNGRLITMIGLNEDHGCITPGGYDLQMLNQRGRHSLAPMTGVNRQIVDVKFATLLLKFH